jgi:hypothetical protein
LGDRHRVRNTTGGVRKPRPPNKTEGVTTAARSLPSPPRMLTVHYLISKASEAGLLNK